MEGDARQLIVLKSLPNSFADSVGLKVNYSKSCMTPINIPEDKFDRLTLTFGCAKGSMPFTYLGLPMGLTKPKVIDFLPLMKRCEKRLAATSMFLSQAGRLELVNSVLTSQTSFVMSTFYLHKTVVKQLDGYRKHCFWRGADLNDKKPPKIA